MPTGVVAGLEPSFMLALKTGIQRAFDFQRPQHDGIFAELSGIGTMFNLRTGAGAGVFLQQQ